MMKKIYMTLMVALALMASSCNKTEGPSAGKKIGEAYVTAKSGAKTVLVSQDGLWGVTSLVDWITIDVNGRNGKGAFTAYYSSNESDFVNVNKTRRGAIVIRNYTTNVADTVYILQQGIPDGQEYKSMPQDSYIEFIDTKLTEMKVVYANFNGCEDASAVTGFVGKTDAQLVALIWNSDKWDEIETAFEGKIERKDSVAFVNKSAFPMVKVLEGSAPTAIAVEVDDVNYQVAAFNPADVLYQQTVSLLESGYNHPGSPSKWVIGGSFYFYSSMEVGYDNTPAWYPVHPSDSAFDSDRYAQTNNLTDCIWMTSRKFNPTFTSSGKSWRADYVYASNSIWNATTAVALGDVPTPGTLHKTVKMTFKY